MLNKTYYSFQNMFHLVTFILMTNFKYCQIYYYDVKKLFIWQFLDHLVIYFVIFQLV